MANVTRYFCQTLVTKGCLTPRNPGDPWRSSDRFPRPSYSLLGQQNDSATRGKRALPASSPSKYGPASMNRTKFCQEKNGLVRRQLPLGKDAAVGDAMPSKEFLASCAWG